VPDLGEHDFLLERVHRLGAGEAFAGAPLPDELCRLRGEGEGAGRVSRAPAGTTRKRRDFLALRSRKRKPARSALSASVVGTPLPLASMRSPRSPLLWPPRRRRRRSSGCRTGRARSPGR
jgi:hypothetical protein